MPTEPALLSPSEGGGAFFEDAVHHSLSFESWDCAQRQSYALESSGDEDKDEGEADPAWDMGQEDIDTITDNSPGLTEISSALQRQVDDYQAFQSTQEALSPELIASLKKEIVDYMESGYGRLAGITRAQGTCRCKV